MSTYRKIHGRSIQAVTTDPSESVAEGQVWYNTTSDTFKSVVAIEAWRSGTVYPRQADHTAGSGTQTAALSCSDNIPSPSAEITSTFEYNGSGWSAGGSMNTERGDGQNNMTGSQTASFYVGGRPNTGGPFGSTATEEYDGSSWTAGGAYPAGMRGTNAFGTLTAGVNAGGNSSSPSVSTNVNNEYNGTAWTSGNNNTLGRFNCSSSGTSTAGILVAGFSNPPPVVNTVTEEYDGSSWTSGGSLPEARNGLGGSGTQTANIVFGGASPPGTKTTTTSKYDGTSWTTSPATLATGREKFGSAKGGSQTATLAWCGNTPTDVTEEFTSSANVITAAAWASGGTYPTNIYGAAGAGDTPAGLLFGGYNGSAGLTTTSEYNGSTWTGGGALPVGKRYLAGFGTQTAALAAKGKAPPGPAVATSEEYNGSSWTAGGTASEAKMSVAGSGTQTSGLVFGGNPSASNSTEEYDGSSWTTGGNLGTGRANHSGSVGGTQTAALTFFGQDGSTPLTLNTEEYNGTAWSEQNNVPVGRFAAGGGGTQTAGYGFGGYLGSGVPTQTTSTIVYDGTSWATQPSMATARGYNSGSAGTAPAGIFTVGDFPAANATEEFTGETTALNVKTLTQS